MSCWRQAVTSVPTADLDSTTTDSLCGWGGWLGGLGVIIESNLNRVVLGLVLGWVVTIFGRAESFYSHCLNQ